MGASRKAPPVVCAMCARSSKWLPASWTHHGSEAYCGSCWDTVKCAQCGHNDPKGTLSHGRYRCRACCHRQRVGAAYDVLDSHHRFVIEDSNGEVPSAAAEEVMGAELFSQDASTAAFVAAIAEAEDNDALEAAEGEDELAPLPSLRTAVQGDAAADRLALRPGHVILLLDMSGSMRTVDVKRGASKAHSGAEAPVARFDAAAECAADFMKAHQRLFPRDVFSLVVFNEVAEVLCAGLEAPQACASLESLPPRCLNGTSYLTALKAGTELLSQRPGARAHVVLLSDGRPADPKPALEHFQAELACGSSACQDRGGELHLHGIGFGETVRSFAPLQQLACLGGGAFALAGSSIRSLCDAFATVSSTITSLSSQGSVGDHSRGEQPARIPRPARFEVPDVGVFGKRGVMRFRASRRAFQFDGTGFKEQRWPPCEVARRVRPHMRGGMRLVYAFCDKRAVAEENSWMVAKCSRWLNEALNTPEVVEAHAKSTAVARYFAACFNAQLRAKACGVPSLFFVPCSVYEAEARAALPEGEPRVFAAERYLPGVFLKYTSNNGYVGADGPGLRHREVVEAFAHFSFAASGARLLVSDLQGVSREAEVLLTDPQVLSLAGPRFGPGDIGPRGLRACLAAHRCGPTCRLLGLRPVSAPQLRRLGAAAAAAPRGGRPGVGGSSATATPSSELSASWERCSEAGAGSEGWEHIGEQDLLELALSDGRRSSQASASSWVHLLDA